MKQLLQLSRWKFSLCIYGQNIVHEQGSVMLLGSGIHEEAWKVVFSDVSVYWWLFSLWRLKVQENHIKKENLSLLMALQGMQYTMAGRHSNRTSSCQCHQERKAAHSYLNGQGSRESSGSKNSGPWLPFRPTFAILSPRPTVSTARYNSAKAWDQVFADELINIQMLACLLWPP